jgi:hypothetical protein
MVYFGGVAFGVLGFLTLAFLLASALQKRPAGFWRATAIVYGQLALVGLPAVFVSALFVVGYNLWSHPWTDLGPIRVPANGTYHVQRYSRTDLFTRELNRDRLFWRSVVVGSFDNHYGAVAMVRPANAVSFNLKRTMADRSPLSRIAFSHDARWIMWLFTREDYSWRLGEAEHAWRGCYAYFVYDRSQDALYGGERLRDLSPFILIGAKDKLDTSDVEALLRESRQDSSLERWRMLSVTIKDAANPNPAVRRAAARALWEFWKEPRRPAALLRKMSQTDPDPAVRKTARRCLYLLHASISSQSRASNTRLDNEVLR